jgi:hypothetical protein
VEEMFAAVVRRNVERSLEQADAAALDLTLHADAHCSTQTRESATTRADPVA